MTNETSSVRDYRHKVKNLLVNARRNYSRNTEAYRLLNGVLDDLLAGRSGVSQEKQVELLTNTLEKANENQTHFAAAAQEAAEAGIENLKAKIENYKKRLAEAEAAVAGEANTDVFEQVGAVLNEAIAFASTRDFEAWQEEKFARRKLAEESYDEDDYEDDDYEDDDYEDDDDD